VLLPIVPQVAVQVDAELAVNCKVPFTLTVGFCGLIVNVVPPVPFNATV
jgi:hypothetical protein